MTFRSVVFLLSLTVIVGIAFGHRPLWHTDLWDHVNYGRHILETGTLPQTEPLLDLTAGQPMVNIAWGSQVGMALIVGDAASGLAGLQLLNGGLIALAIGSVGWAVVRKTGSVFFGVGSVLVFLVVAWQQFLVIRPQLIGVVFFCFVFASLTVCRAPSGRQFVLLPLMFACWANLHGSFAMGLTLMALIGAGQGADVLIRTGSLKAVVSHKPLRRLFVLTVLCAAAVVINPNGIHVYPEILSVGRHPNISSMYEWDPLSLSMKQGKAAASVFTLLVAIAVVSPRRRWFADMVPLFAIGVLMLWSARMINWFAPIVAYLLAVHAAASWNQGRHSMHLVGPSARSLAWTWLNMAVLCSGIACCLLGRQTLSGEKLKPDTFLSGQTPLRTAEFLASQSDLPSGIAFMPAEWTGVIMYFGPETIRPMVNLHVHVMPETVWNDYLRVIEPTENWAQILEAYGIRLVVTDKRRQAPLIRGLQMHGAFDLLYEDSQAAVFLRRAGFEKNVREMPGELRSILKMPE